MRIERMKCWNLPELITIFLLLVFAVTGCDEAGTMMKPVVSADKPVEEPAEPPTTVAEVKQDPEIPVKEPTTEPVAAEPDEPTPPVDTTPPTVVRVEWYSDWQLTEAITDNVQPSDTLYTIVVFSEPMMHTVGDDETARPALSIVLDSVATPYQMVTSDIVGDDFTSGMAKPLRSGTDDYLCKYTVPANTGGSVALQIGAETTDRAGNPITETAVHTAPFVVEVEPEPEIDVESVTFYENIQRTQEMTEDSNVRLGDVDTIYTEVVLKELAETPLQLGFSIGDDVTVFYKERTEGTILLSGECKEIDTGVYLCLYIPVEGSPTGTFDLVVGGERYTAPTEITPVEVYPTRESIHREWNEKVSEIWGSLDFEAERDREFKRFFGFPAEFSERRLINIFLQERPDDGKGLQYWQDYDCAVEYLYLHLHNPDAGEEELEELFRESVRAGEVIINPIALR